MKSGRMVPSGTSSVRANVSARDSRVPGDSGIRDWRLPSGQGLAEFALQSGFLAPFLMDSRWLSPRPHPDGAQAAKAAEPMARARE